MGDPLQRIEEEGTGTCELEMGVFRFDRIAGRSTARVVRELGVGAVLVGLVAEAVEAREAEERVRAAVEAPEIRAARVEAAEEHRRIRAGEDPQAEADATLTAVDLMERVVCLAVNAMQDDEDPERWWPCRFVQERDEASAERRRVWVGWLSDVDLGKLAATIMGPAYTEAREAVRPFRPRAEAGSERGTNRGDLRQVAP